MQQTDKKFKLVSNKKTRTILPNMFTLVGVCIGLTSIKFAFDERFGLAIICIIVAGLIDGLDGRIARLIKGTSQVGKELDSLTDVISFGVAPAFIMYFWQLNTLGRVGWLICLVYVICVALRLARFNSKLHVQDKKYFLGLASPASAAVIICYAWVIIDTGLNVESFKWLSLILLIFLSTLMVTNITYYSFKDIDLRQKVPHISLFVIVIVLSFISFDPPLVLLSFFSIYALSGPSLFLLRLFRKRSINTRERRSER